MRTTCISLLLCGLAIALGLEAKAQSPAGRDRADVVFVCEHGSVKSLVAMEHFNRKAKARGLPYHAVARGTAPERAVPEAVQAGLRADGFDTSGFVPQSLTSSDLDHAILVVSFDRDVTPAVAGRVRYLAWDNLPGVLTDYPRGRAEIVRRVDSLVDELARRSPR